MVASITVRLPPVDRPAAFTSGPRPGTPSPGPTTYPRVTGSLDTAASLDRFRRLSARYIASPCRRARIHPKLRHTTRRDYRKLLGRGHTTASITTDTYGHLIRSELEELAGRLRSEEHTSELQSRPHLVCRLLLEQQTRTSRALAISLMTAMHVERMALHPLCPISSSSGPLVISPDGILIFFF